MGETKEFQSLGTNNGRRLIEAHSSVGRAQHRYRRGAWVRILLEQAVVRESETLIKRQLLLTGQFKKYPIKCEDHLSPLQSTFRL